ncbi:penicillin-binding protein [Candidatus Marinamargulisbacteria bacterium SCGC AG-439-L15]|nr:penicillin-binding protein [Candidatus Marinamargulisbacteria bacterium SCGC AG-439-L15]
MNRKSSKMSSGFYSQSQLSRRRRTAGIFKKLFFYAAIAGFVMVIFGGGFVYYLAGKLPNVDQISTYIPSETTKIYAKDGTILAELHREENRILIPIERISPTLQKTVIAMEDTDFYKHHGINFKGIMRALYKDILARSFVQGGSTLTQQLARNLFLHKQKKIIRKISEMILAIQIERKYTKTEILEMYLNQVYWGHNSYGIESASQLYFGKSAQSLTLSESAVLVGMLKGPELFSPFKNMERSKRRQRVVLQRMKRLGLINGYQLEIAYRQPLVLAKRRKHRYKAPFFTSYIVDKLVKMYGEAATFTSGMKVYTTLDYPLQKHAEKVVRKYVDLADKPYWIKGEKVSSLNVTQGAILAVDPRTGYIRAMRGGVDFKKNEFNRCVQSYRQPGSAFKPFVYLAALKKGFSPGTFIEDAPVTFNTIEGPYSPKNYTLKHLGRIPMSKALERSVNVVAIKLNDLVGPKNVVSLAKSMGISSPLKPILSLPLGANEVTMLELTSSYMVMANNGVKVNPVAILKIEDRNGIPMYTHRIREKQVVKPKYIAALVEMMERVVNYGTGRGAKLPVPMAGKTGTTSDYKDAWFMGYTPQLVCAAWVGNDDNKPMKNVTGGWLPARMWRDFMKEAIKESSAQAFARPRGMVSRKINWETGLLASQYTSAQAKVSVLKYWVGSEPKQADSRDTIQSVIRLKNEEEKQENQILDFFEVN